MPLRNSNSFMTDAGTGDATSARNAIYANYGVDVTPTVVGKSSPSYQSIDYGNGTVTINHSTPGGTVADVVQKYASGGSSGSGTDLSQLLSMIGNLGAYELAAVNAQIDADRSNARELMNWTSGENSLNRAFQQASADKEMQFNADQAQLARDWSSTEAQLARDFDSAEAQKARDWSKMMSDTAMQRSVADMKAAGINPILAAGTPASTPSASAANVSGGPALPGATGAHAAGSMSSAQKAQAQKAQAASVIGDVLNFVTQGLNRDQQQYFFDNLSKKDVFSSIFNTLGRVFEFSLIKYIK